MEISFYTHALNLQRRNGYGVAGFNVVTSLQRLGHKVPFNSPKSPVQLNMCQPSFFADFIDRPDQYSIGYAPWESTLLPEDWADILNDCQEAWTTSEWCKEIFEENGVKSVKVYKHGVDPVFVPKKRQREPFKPFTFLHHGEPAVRKGGQLAYDAFKAAFGYNNKDVQLIIKANETNTVRQRRNTMLVDLPGNVKVVRNLIDDDVLVELYHDSHAMVYPSAGEGLGLIPLQALATGMPVICTAKWADYASYLGDLAVDSKYQLSPWPKEHPGYVCQPDKDDLVDKMRYTYNNYDSLATRFHKQAFNVHKEYDWDSLTRAAFDPIVNKFSRIAFSPDSG